MIKLESLYFIQKNYHDLRENPQKFFPNLDKYFIETELLIMDEIIDKWGWKLIDNYATSMIKNGGYESSYKIDGEQIDPIEHGMCLVIISMNDALSVYQERSSEVWLAIIQAKHLAQSVCGMGFEAPTNFVAHDLAKYSKKIAENSKRSAEAARKAKDNRKKAREAFAVKVKEHIIKTNMWNDATNTIQSITNDIWQDVQRNVKEKGKWQGLQIDLKKSKIGKQTVYDAVSETAPY